MAAVTLDLSKAQPLPQAPVQLDMSKAEPLPDNRSLLQKAQEGFDKLTNVTPEQEAGHGAIVNAMQRFGAGAIQGLGSPIVHPLDTLGGIARAVAHPIDAIHADVNALESDPAKYAGNAVGGAILGEAAAPVVGKVVDAVKSGAQRAALLGRTPEGAYESALKPSTVLSPSERASVIRTGLQNEIPISKAGLEKLTDRIDTLNQAIKDQISSDPKRPIDPNAVATRADAARVRFSNQVNAGGDLQAIEASKQQFLTEQGAANGNPAPPMGAADAQAMKQGTYQVLRGKFGEQGSASVEAQKALARGLKEEIANQFPEISKLNAEESRLLDLQPVLERAVNRISNHQAIGIGTPVAGAAAKAVTGSGGIGVVATVIKGVLDNPTVASKLAIAISKSSNIPIAQAISKVRAYSSALGASVASTQASSQDGSQGQSASTETSQ